MAKNKGRKMTFRQRLRAQATEKLNELELAMLAAAHQVRADFNIELNVYNIMRLLCTGKNKSLRYRLVTELANEQEAELEALYNRQMNLLEEDSNGE